MLLLIRLLFPALPLCVETPVSSGSLSEDSHVSTATLVSNIHALIQARFCIWFGWFFFNFNKLYNSFSLFS